MFTQRLHGISVQQSTTRRMVDIEHDRREWIHTVTGVRPEPTFEEPVKKRTPKQTPLPKPILSTEAFDEIFKTMNDTPLANIAELGTLRKEVSKVKTKLVTAEEENVICAKQTKSAQAAQVNAEARVKIMKADRDSFKKLADEYTSKYRTAHKDLEASCKQRKEETALHAQEKEKTRAWTRTNKTLEQTLKEKDRQLKSAREETRTAKAQILRIRTMMKMAKEAESQKRKSSGDAVGSDAKMARIRF